MAKITKKFIIESLAAFSVIGLVAGGGIVMNMVNPDWNHGGKPWNDHPYKKAVDSFDPPYTLLVYMDVDDDANKGLYVRATRIHFKSVNYGSASNNTWENNQNQVIDCINYLNSNYPKTDCNGAYKEYKGLHNFKLGYPHHVVFYIRNYNVRYNKDYPIWFGDLLIEQDSDKKHKKADENWSYFGVHVYTPTDSAGDLLITGTNSTDLIYVKNYFTRPDFLKGYDHIKGERTYSVNINAEIDVKDILGNPSTIMPLIIDPDTGNMGGGQP